MNIVTKKNRESSIEKQVCDYAVSKKWLPIKLRMSGGMPDRMFLRDGKVFFIEFKKHDGVVKPLQILRGEELKALGFKVYIVRNTKDGMKIIDDMTKTGRC